MSSTPFPATLADLQLHQDGAGTGTSSLYRAIKDIRRATLSIPNRLRSIQRDADFVARVGARHGGLPLIANERCGGWYIAPASKAGSAYFKSTDGHHGQWDFSLRRLNLPLLFLLGERGGAVLVDSTRRGKGVPDSLAKTVPIWVAVVNRTLFPEREEWRRLQCLAGLGESEVAQIESRLDGFVQRFRELVGDVQYLRDGLKRPIRVRWATNGAETPPSLAEPGWDMLDDVDLDLDPDAEDDERDSYCTLVLCSASRRVRGAEVSEGGYIQGAGDDSEAWSHGLTPELFWENKDLLLRSAEEDLPDIIRELVVGKMATGERFEPVEVRRVKGIYIAAYASTKEKATGGSADQARDGALDFDLIINCNLKDSSASHSVLDLGCRTGKLGSRDLREKLPVVKSFVSPTFERNPACRILITCATGKDLSVGVAVMLLCLFYDDCGALRNANAFEATRIDKVLVKKRLSWISSSKPDVNPSRSTLQSVNAFLIERP